RSGDSRRSNNRRYWRRSRWRRWQRQPDRRPWPTAETLGFSLAGGGSNAAGDGQRGEGERCNLGRDRHDINSIRFGCGTVLVRMPSWTEAFRFRFESRSAVLVLGLLRRYCSHLPGGFGSRESFITSKLSTSA